MMTTLALLIPALLLLVLHWAPWEKALRRDLPRLVSYALGAFTIVGVPTVLQYFLNPTYGEMLHSFWAALFGAGAGTVLGWTVDAMLELSHLQDDETDRYGR